MINRGYVFYDGPSILDGQPIVGIVTLRSANEKTGDMIQTWILRSDISPLSAIHTGDDVSICGDCPLRGHGGLERGCYVNVAQAPLSIWRAYRAGKYPPIVGELPNRPVRLGAYGDPAAIPLAAWGEILNRPRTGYTHQWRRFPEWKPYVMASIHTETERVEAHALGWRTFRLVSDISDMSDREVLCPASSEAGKRTQCINCLLCSGAELKAKSVVILPHGAGEKYAGRLSLPVV